MWGDSFPRCFLRGAVFAELVPLSHRSQVSGLLASQLLWPLTQGTLRAAHHLPLRVFLSSCL